MILLAWMLALGHWLRLVLAGPVRTPARAPQAPLAAGAQPARACLAPLAPLLYARPPDRGR